MASSVRQNITYQLDDAQAYDWLNYPWEELEEQWLNVQGDYTVELLDAGFNGVQLRQVSRQLSSGVSIIVVPKAGGSALSIAPQNQRPSAGQFRPDWQFFTGRIEFNRSQLGEEFTIKYVSSGSAITLANLDDQLDKFIGLTDARTFGGNVNVTGNLTAYNVISQNDMNAGGDMTIAGDLAITGDLAVSWGGTATPVNGYIEDGTKLYAKWISGSITNGNSSVDLPHGISNAATNKRIKISQVYIEAGDGSMRFPSDVTGASSDIPWGGFYDDTNVRIVRAGTTGTFAAYAFVVYEA